MKSGVASHILAVRYLKELGFTPKGDVMINVVIDEEVSGHGTLDTVIRGYKADAGISGETSDLAVQPACIGRIWFEIEIHGKPAGIQKRYEGISGIDLGNKIAKAVADLEGKRVATVTHPLYPSAIDSLPCIVGSFQAGGYPSAFPANCLLKGSIGTVPGEDHEGVKQSLVDQVAGNTPTVIFGPGSTAVMHADDEYVSIDDYLTSIKVMALAIYDWCNAEPIRQSA
jgi:acetylornithine deacetylase